MALLNAKLLSISISTNEDITSQISIAKLRIVNKQAGMRLLKVTEVKDLVRWKKRRMNSAFEN